MLIHPLITDTETLAALCARLAEADFVTVDTEFMRESTYYPDLCLVQVASPTEAAAIDPKADGIDLTPLLKLLVEDEVLKVFHAGGQDLEIIYNLTGKTPAPLFDTQIAAMALGLGEQIGYTNLVAAYSGVQIDKGARFTDWARRPLNDRQLDYAIGDVTHLATLFPKMVDKLRRTGRGAWLDEEMARACDPATYANDPDKAWTRLRLPSRKPEVLGRLKALARWRELEAQDKDVPRGRIIKDETLGDLAGSPPRSQADLAKVRGLSAAWAANAIGDRLMRCLQDAGPLPADEMPAREAQRPGLSSEGALIADLLKLLLKIRSKETGVAPKLIVRGDDLDALAAGVRDGLPVLQSWRRGLFGDDALALVEGRLGFVVKDGKLTMTRVAD
ncbi:ribonuclease D [Polymorphobacter fuscus]|uniref:Ribonuclease D n=1 Tax=Sandarakinorhabdus fusca TaxID=1439888 RepID=A0A7C9GMU1_9SPHN|nr:ribonuclease D [Polymorphobacter fuscus]KAB7648710.1 ribonuclease D [Polymorphobacter fuscus]MQT16272.1 ribonuclease D [Polymorphobacter fuscus]NJC07443.1 ribonuclease D [Polymorphobacter fuscus]